MGIGYFAWQPKTGMVMPDMDMLKFSDKDRKSVQWYAEGEVCQNDIIAYVGRKRTEAGIDQLVELGGQSIKDDQVEVVLLKYCNESFLPFYKPLSESGEVDTVFSKVHIKIKISPRFTVSVNDAIYTDCFNAEEGHLLLIRDGRVCYFSEAGSVATDFYQVLESKRFQAYRQSDEPVLMEDFFDAALCEKIKSITKRGQREFHHANGKVMAITLEGEDRLLTGCKFFSMGDEESYLQNVKKNMAIYDRLYFDNELKVGSNELDCDARLRGYGQNIEEINRKLDKVCRKNVTIVMTGESGTGKTFLARRIHNNSRRMDGPFVNVNCASIAYNLIESELFGYEEGAFTGARKGGKIGYFEMAKGGTLFLDEISELPLLLQGKLLEVLQEGTFYRVGGTKKVSADVRLIVATNRNLEKMVREGKFREDLYYRINVFPIHLPPLRERIEDLYSIVEDALPEICNRLEIDTIMMTNDALEKMKNYRWPGNIRELENVLEKATVMADENFIREKDIILDNPVVGERKAATLKEKLSTYEKELIRAALVEFNGDRRKMEQNLGISKTNLFDKLRKYELDGDISDIQEEKER